jgi:hypothetical protein
MVIYISHFSIVLKLLVVLIIITSSYKCSFYNEVNLSSFNYVKIITSNIGSKCRKCFTSNTNDYGFVLCNQKKKNQLFTLINQANDNITYRIVPKYLVEPSLLPSTNTINTNTEASEVLIYPYNNSNGFRIESKITDLCLTLKDDNKLISTFISLFKPCLNKDHSDFISQIFIITNEDFGNAKTLNLKVNFIPLSITTTNYQVLFTEITFTAYNFPNYADLSLPNLPIKAERGVLYNINVELKQSYIDNGYKVDYPKTYIQESCNDPNNSTLDQTEITITIYQLYIITIYNSPYDKYAKSRNFRLQDTYIVEEIEYSTQPGVIKSTPQTRSLIFTNNTANIAYLHGLMLFSDSSSIYVPICSGSTMNVNLFDIEFPINTTPCMVPANGQMNILLEAPPQFLYTDVNSACATQFQKKIGTNEYPYLNYSPCGLPNDWYITTDGYQCKYAYDHDGYVLKFNYKTYNWYTLTDQHTNNYCLNFYKLILPVSTG